MKILIAPNAYKNSLNALEVGLTIKNAWLEVRPTDDIVVKPLADGGDGFAEIVGKEKQGEKIEVVTKNALGKPYNGYYYKVNQATAIIDLASNCGMQTISNDELDALETNTEGLGIVILKAINDGCKEIILGLGGSASTDFGLGALYSLGCKFYNFENKEIVPNGRNLDLIYKIDTSLLSSNVKDIHFFMAIDVENRLLGSKGAAYVFGPQKGANKSEVELLDFNLKHIARFTQQTTGKDVENLIGGGAAGGCAAGFWAFLNAEPMKGSQFMMEVMDINTELEKADLVFTAEGKIDDQSLEGKIPYVIGLSSKHSGTPCISLVGVNALSKETLHPFHSIFSINQNWESIDNAIQETSYNLGQTAKQIAKLIDIKT